MVYGLKVALRHEREKDGIVIKVNKSPTLYAELVDMGAEAKKRFPDLKIGMTVVAPFVASATIDNICYVSAYDLVGFFRDTVDINNFVAL